VTELRLDVNKRYEDEERRRAALDDLDRLLDRFDLIDVERPVAVAAANIISSLKRQVRPLHDLHDAYIAATARTEQLSVLTANTDHFERIDGVDVVDWERF